MSLVPREDFPILSRDLRGRRLVYLDNAATTHKPRTVLESVLRFYEKHNANVHRAAHLLSEEATALYEGARDKVAQHLNAPAREGIVFTRGTTESINLVAYAYGRTHVREGDVVLITLMEHHSNIVPWQLLCQEKGAELVYVEITEDGLLDEDHLVKCLARGPKIFAFTHMSNVLGTVNPAARYAAMGKEAGATVLVDGAQSTPHFPVDLQAIPCDFYAFSGHKMLGPTGVGVLYGRPELLEAMPPFLAGGEMIKSVGRHHATWNDIPHKFEAGTPNIAQVVGLGAAITYLQQVGLDRVHEHERKLTRACLERLQAWPQVTTYGPRSPEKRGGVISFAFAGVHPHDIATILDEQGVAVRAGHHCAQPLMEHLQVPATARASFYLYNDEEDVDAFLEALRRVEEIFRPRKKVAT